MTAQQDGEGLAEICIEGIDDGVEGGISPSEPHEHVKRGGADAWEILPAARLLAEGHHAVEDEEREPAAYKHAHDHGECLQHLCLPLECHFERALGLSNAGPSAHAVVSVLGTFGRTLQGRNPPDLSVRNAVYLGVSGHHDGHRNVKAYE